jgi:hypothetical protein
MGYENVDVYVDMDYGNVDCYIETDFEDAIGWFPWILKKDKQVCYISIYVYNTSYFQARKAYEDGDLRAWTRYTARARFLVFVTCIAGLVVYGAIIGLVHAVRHVHYK